MTRLSKNEFGCRVGEKPQKSPMRIKTRFSCRLGAPLAIAGCPGVPGTAAMDLKRLYYRPIGGALLRFAKRSCRMVHIMCTTQTTRRAARSCGVCKDATRETTTPPPPTCIELHLCHAMGWVGETISHLRRTSSRPFRVAAPDLGCNETIGVEHELHRCSKPPQACALCHGGAL